MIEKVVYKNSSLDFIESSKPIPKELL